MHNTVKQAAPGRNLLRELTQRGDQSWDRLLRRSAGPNEVVRRDPPANFQFPYLVGRPIPYECGDGDGRGVSGGVLNREQVVWLEHPLTPGRSGRGVRAFTASAGIIRLDARGLSQIWKG